MNGKDTLTIMQGDQIPIGVRLEGEDGESITPSATTTTAQSACGPDLYDTRKILRRTR